MRPHSTLIPQVERLEVRSIPGSLLGLAAPLADPLGDWLALETRLPAVRQATSGWSIQSPVNQIAPASPSRLPQLAVAASQNKGAIDQGVAPATSELELALAGFVKEVAFGAHTSRQATARHVQIRQSSVGCITTDISVIPYKIIDRSWPPQPTDGTTALLGLVIFINDDCENYPLTDAQGFITNPNAFRTAADGRTASLTGTIPMLNAPIGAGFDAIVSVTWAAAGPPVSETNASRFESEIEVFHATERPAIASGTIYVGSTNVLPGPTTDAALQTIQTVVITLE